MRIDAHQHYWRIDRGDYGWITPGIPVLYRDFGPEHLLPHLKEHRLDGTIAVQAAATYEETDYLLALSDRTDSIIGVVGWLDLAVPDYFARYERFARHPKFAGFRVMIQDMPNAETVLEPACVEALKRFAELDVPVDLLLLSSQLGTVAKLLDRVPGLRAVIDHIAKPRIADAELEPWSGYMAEIAAHPNVYCKLSGMVTEAGSDGWQQEQFVPYARRALDLFGPNRVLFGSDWPVCLLAASYDDVVNVLVQALPEDWDREKRDRLFGLNAKEFYKR